MIYMRYPGGLSKALTLSYDDGVEQDVRLMDILDRRGLKCTFNVNSGLYAPSGMVWPKGQVHRRMSLQAAKALYIGSGHEVAVHGVAHQPLAELPDGQVAWEISRDRENLEREFGGIVRGMAYAMGSFDDRVAEIAGRCGILYARVVAPSHSFSIPKNWLQLEPTCHHNDPELMPLLEKFLADDSPYACSLFYLWGHSYEFEGNDNWHVIEAFADRAGGHADVWYATNIEIFEYIEAYRQLRFTADCSRVYNPTCREIWLKAGDCTLSVKPGETAIL